MDLSQTLEGLKCSIMDYGVRFVTMALTNMLLLLFVNILATGVYFFLFILFSVCLICLYAEMSDNKNNP